MYKGTGPKEGVAAHKVLEDKTGFAYQTLLGELMYAYITCQPDIGYSIKTLSKFSCAPTEYHYKLLQMIAKYLQVTAHWGICFKRSKPYFQMINDNPSPTERKRHIDIRFFQLQDWRLMVILL